MPAAIKAHANSELPTGGWVSQLTRQILCPTHPLLSLKFRLRIALARRHWAPHLLTVHSVAAKCRRTCDYAPSSTANAIRCMQRRPKFCTRTRMPRALRSRNQSQLAGSPPTFIR